MKRPRAYGVLGETQFSTEIFEMTLEKDEWRIDFGLNPWDWTIKVRVMDRGIKGYWSV